MIIGVGGIGRKYWVWVWACFSDLYLSRKLIVFLGDFLLRSLLKALLMKEKHTLENQKFDSMFPEDVCNGWLSMIRNWERDKSRPNPFTHMEKGILFCMFQFFTFVYICPATKLAELCRQLAEQDEEDVRRGTIQHQVPGSVFVRNRLEIEEQQLGYKLLGRILIVSKGVIYQRTWCGDPHFQGGLPASGSRGVH